MPEGAVKQATKPGWQSSEAILTAALAWIAREVTARKPETTEHAIVTGLAMLCLTFIVWAYSQQRSRVKERALSEAFPSVQAPTRTEAHHAQTDRSAARPSQGEGS